MTTPSQEIHEQDHLALWAQLQRAEDRSGYVRAWLGLQVSRIAATQAAVAVLRRDEAFVPEARWPAEGGQPERLSELVERVLADAGGLVTELPAPAGASHYGIGYPVLVDGDAVGAVALELRADSETTLREAMSQLQWGVAWLELWFRRGTVRQQSAAQQRLQDTVDLFASVIAEGGAEAAATAFATELAARTGSDRVSVGFLRDRRVRVLAVSHTAHFTRRMNLHRAIEAAMEEAVTQRDDVRYPAPESGVTLVTRDHEALARLQGVACLLTVPLYADGQYYGAVTLERAVERPYDEADVAYVRGVSALAGPALDGKRREARALPLKAVDALREQGRRLLGPGFTGRKVAVVAVVAVALFLALARGDYRLTADVTLEGEVQRAVVAPFDGYVAAAEVRAGDVIDAGQVLARLDDRDLRLEYQRLAGQISQLTQQLQEALATHDRVNVNIITAQLQQTRAQLDLLDSRLQRTHLRAPLAGIVVEGDLSQRLAGAVAQGEVLFQVAPLDDYRVILQVDERRIGDVEVGQRGRLVLAAMPNRELGFRVTRITPIATPQEGVNTFRVEAELDRGAAGLRPGMKGVGKIDVDRRQLLSIWTRDAVEWLRLTAWEYLP